MIVVKIELWPKGNKTLARTIGMAVISNDATGTPFRGNYVYALAHSGKYAHKRGVYKQGTIRNFLRRSSVYRLIHRVFTHAGET